MELVSNIALLSDLAFAASERVVLRENGDCFRELLKEVILILCHFLHEWLRPLVCGQLVDPQLNPDHVPHMLKKCPDPIPDPKAVQYVRNDRGTPMKLDNNYYKNILENKGLMLVDHQLATDKRKKPFVKKMAKNQDYFFKQFSKAITILSENNPLTGSKGEIRKQCNLANKLH
ncbi:unnamed protein product [Cuscuta epithymum]|uniref:peroxidase n=1 Tax=Cuscuta epithymum TaxID=186058 RepID=A0AAV0FDE1_9ASTE|nr:unnamed protein product [Cuscuta epithymum]